MAVHGTTDQTTNQTTTTPAPGVSPTQPNTHAPGYTATGDTLFTWLNQLGSGQALGPDIEKYIESLKSFLPKEHTPAMTIKRLAEPQGAHAVVCGKNAFILLFDQLLSRDTQNFVLPSSDRGAEAYNSLKRELPGTTLLNFIVIQPEDYTRVQQAAQHMSVFLSVSSSAINNTNISLLSNNEFYIDLNVDSTKAFIEARNLHTVQPRIDIGFTLYAKSNRRGQQPMSIEEPSRPIAALGAYVDIWETGGNIGIGFGGPSKYQATIRITNITSEIPLSGMVPLMMTIAANQFIDKGRWAVPFTSFQKGKPNLGNLSVDPDDKNRLWEAKTMDDVNRWVNANMLGRPILGIDVAEGQARIPGVADYQNTDTPGRVYDQITTFFGNTPLDRSTGPFKIHGETFVGCYGDTRGTLLDSRTIDYLSLVAQGTVDPSARMLLQHRQDPTVRARFIYDTTRGSFRSINRTSVSILNAQLLATLAQSIVKSVKIIGGDQQQNIIPTPWLDDVVKQYNSNTFNTQSASQNQQRWGGVNYGI